MRLASFLVEGAPSYGVITDAGAHPALPAQRATCPTLRDYLRTRPVAGLPGQCGAALPLDSLVWLPPIPAPGKILCAGMNYRKPYPVAGVAPPDPGHVVLFSRHPQTLVGHGAMLEMPQGAAAESFDFEGEIVAVIGQPGRHIAPEAALGHVLGYSAMNEGSVRGWMKHSVHAGKNFHASGSWGPWITTADEAGDIAGMTLETRVNGTPMQSDSGAGMIFGLAELIAYISHIQPLEAGDIIATGSPDGTGGSRTPPAFLRSGDRVAVTVGGVGTLKNTVGAS
ncbi:fumarylacetoacetate hydrolase family protein [Ruegeria pomeroyi]|uniref:Fumarylacetoacetate hydrolase family protein n=2 Tax=Ruegeria pomeroyi TaxID=89184 RepID=Q5LT14_RUEPO|nr:fumarylacetoacetate hydrolase family protein [Ruegeria pomeroyi]AAV94887.1 fumarylacetoacetate hydrolase family protein [Ruegeria pomeroyi DSS-3]NVK96264.1 fumarylacetoacetate hydrolase family protein [Ruegeria pomeroyi]NVL02906.1 fumarylacetoacetate hydrolase family protein [Ruegeria pomeroyi]QWV08459.1 fumarylacetoacetate hydrolase family protein [Ruegeria pomeroyi]